MRFLLALFLVLAMLCNVDAAETVELGRRFKAIPWLEELGEVPTAVVPFDSIPLLVGVPRVTDLYEIDSNVVASGFSYFFYVLTEERDYLVGSTIKLAQLCREIAASNELKNTHKGKEFAEGVGESIVGIGTGFGNLIVHPGQSFKSFGSKLRSAGRFIERAVGGEPAIGVDERGVERSELGSGPAGGQRRRIAYELGIDVYTDNPVLREQLISLSQAKTAGTFASWVVPYSLGTLGYFNPLAGDGETEAFIRDFEPYDLRREIGKRLEPVFSMSREDDASDLFRFLMNPNYTPREIAYIGKGLEAMARAENIHAVLRLLAGADTPEKADRYALVLRLNSLFNEHMQPVAAFRPFADTVGAIGKDGILYFMVAVDTLRPWDAPRDLMDRLMRLAVQSGVKDVEIWTIGDVHPLLVKSAAARGVTVRQNILRDPAFFPQEERMRHHTNERKKPTESAWISTGRKVSEPATLWVLFHRMYYLSYRRSFLVRRRAGPLPAFIRRFHLAVEGSATANDRSRSAGSCPIVYRCLCPRRGKLAIAAGGIRYEGVSSWEAAGGVFRATRGAGPGFSLVGRYCNRPVQS